MSMPLLYNIEKCNNTVTIQSSVSMYTEVYRKNSFSIIKGATRPVSSDLKTHFVRPFWAPVASATGFSARVRDSLAPRSVIVLCISTPTECGK